jgi:hypothetical protein
MRWKCAEHHPQGIPILATASSNAVRYASVPLTEYSAADQIKAADKINAACGSPPRCPADAILEQMVLDYGRTRAMVRAAGAGK